MFKNFLVVSFRAFKSKKIYSIINISGLCLSICIAGLVYLYIKYENSFDHFHVNKGRIFRLESNIYFPRNINDPYLRIPQLSNPLVERIRSNVPGIEKSTRYAKGYRTAIVQFKDKVFSEEITYVDDDFFEIFSFEFIAGNRRNIFNDGSAIVISETTAYKYFGQSDPIGKVISIDGDDKKLYTVQGIVKDPPENSSIDFSFVVPVESWAYFENYKDQPTEYTYAFFVLLTPNTNSSSLKTSLDALVEQSMKLEINDHKQRSDIRSEATKAYEVTISPLPEIHWNTKMSWDKTTNRKSFKILIGISVIIIIIACVNFVSLSLVTSSGRRIEVGIRKVFGASGKQIARQFTFESILYSFLSTFIALILVYILLPYFNTISGKKIPFSFDIFDFLFFSLLAAAIGLLAGSYPAFFLSSFQPAVVLKSRVIYKYRTLLVSVLVIFQFSLSLFLCNNSFIMLREMNYINTKDLGFNQQQIIIIPLFAEGENAKIIVERFKSKAKSEPTIISTTAASQTFFQGLSNMGFVNNVGEQKSTKVYTVDPDFIETVGLQLIQGKSFSRTDAGKNEIIINESLAKEIADDHPMNQIFSWGSGETSEVVAIVKDFHFRSFEYPIEPLFLTMNEKAGELSNLLVRIEPTNIHNTIDKIQKIWSEVNPNKPFEFSFLEEAVAKQYESYQRWSNIMTFATAFGTFIACIGLFGLAGINTSNRYHEIGIRKVLGAHVADIFFMVNRQYLVLLIISSLIAVAASYIVMSKWISNFTYSISIGFEFIVYGILVGVSIGMCAVGWHAVKASLTNPADTIRYE